MGRQKIVDDEDLNVDNFMMSDSLTGRFDVNSVDEEVKTPPTYGGYVCEMSFSSYKLAGEMKSLARKHDRLTISFILRSGDPIGILDDCALLSYRLIDVSGMTVYSDEWADGTTVSASINMFENDECYLVTIVIIE